MSKSFYKYGKLEWLSYLVECVRTRKPDEVAATDKQRELLTKLFVPVGVIDRITIGQASEIISSRMAETKRWKAEQQRKGQQDERCGVGEDGKDTGTSE